MLRKRPLFVILSCVITSYLTAYFIPVGFVRYIIAALVLAVAAFLPFYKLRDTALLILLPLAMAFLSHNLFTVFSYQPFEQFKGQQIELQGEIISDYGESTSSEFFTLRPMSVIFENKVYRVNGDVLVYFEAGGKHFDIGSIVSCYATAFEDDDQKFAIDSRKTNRQFLSVYCSDMQLLSKPSTLNFYNILSTARAKVKAIYADVFSTDAAALIEGITLGDTESITDKLYFQFKSSGVSHTLAVSGMHLAFLTAILWYIFALLSRNLYIRSLLQLILIWCFAALTGFSPSCCRAAVMLSVFQLGILLNKESDTVTSLALAIVVCCLRNPYAILNPSLILSVTATAGILLVTAPVSSLFPRCKNSKNIAGKIYNSVINIISMSVAATIGTLPAIIYLYCSVTLLSPLTNVMIVPAVQILFFCGFLAVAVGWCPPIAAVLKWLGDILYRFCNAVTEWISDLPFCSVYVDNWWSVLIFVLVIGVAVAVYLLFCKKHRMYIMPIYIAMFVAVITCFYGYDYSVRDNITIQFVDVGQGNTAIISNDHDAILVDCGGSGTAYSEINRCLSRSSVRSVSAIYLTHMDWDHIKYLQNIVESYSVEMLYLPYRTEYREDVQELLSSILKSGTHITYISSDRLITLWDKAVMKVYTEHIEPSADDENENSLVYKLTYDQNEILFSGDVEGEGEKRLYQTYRSQLESDVLLISHHGSKNASSVEFLTYVDARIAVISVGEDNRYGMPNADTLKRIKKYTQTLLRTDTYGTVRLVMNGQKCNIVR